MDSTFMYTLPVYHSSNISFSWVDDTVRQIFMLLGVGITIALLHSTRPQENQHHEKQYAEDSASMNDYKPNSDWERIPRGTEIRHTRGKHSVTTTMTGDNPKKFIREFANGHIGALKASGAMKPNSKVRAKIYSEVEFKDASGEWKLLDSIRFEEPEPVEEPTTLIPLQDLAPIILDILRYAQRPMEAKEIVAEINANPPTSDSYTVLNNVNGRLYSMLIKQLVVRETYPTGAPTWRAAA